MTYCLSREKHGNHPLFFSTLVHGGYDPYGVKCAIMCEMICHCHKLARQSSQNAQCKQCFSRLESLNYIKMSNTSRYIEYYGKYFY